ncbi:hypothetical protein CEXT_137481 [Caerostris extrusa]|uniref:Uncharacterized protein n=1 Tax=Caerostris extrusa TaxID=172846 RepID=A0AAV4Y9K6_CAEEX|nr:hypothetical protein CEXT_137481 [Caerostris extrusa]
MFCSDTENQSPGDLAHPDIRDSNKSKHSEFRPNSKALYASLSPFAFNTPVFTFKTTSRLGIEPPLLETRDEKESWYKWLEAWEERVSEDHVRRETNCSPTFHFKAQSEMHQPNPQLYSNSKRSVTAFRIHEFRNVIQDV